GGRRHRGLGRCGADIGQGLRFGERDLALGGLGPPRDEIFHLGLGIRRDALGFCLGVRDDLLGLALGAGPAGLVVGQQLGGLFLDAAGGGGVWPFVFWGGV